MNDFTPILTAQNIADYLHISRRRVYELMDLSDSLGGIPSFRIGASKKASRRIAREDFEKWLTDVRGGEATQTTAKVLPMKRQQKGA